MRFWIVAAAAAASVAGLVGASFVSPLAVAAVTALLCAVAAIGWPHLLGVPARKRQSAAIGLSAIAATAAAAFTPGPGFMVWFPGAVALGVSAVFLIQLLRGTGQSHRLESTLGASSGVFAVALGSGWAAADRLPVNAAGTSMMLVTGISVLAGLAGLLPRWPDRVAAPLGLVLAAAAGCAGALLLPGVPVLPAVLVGLVSGAVLVSGRRLLTSREAPLNAAAALSAGITPVLAIGALVYFLDTLLLS
ncbi:hypothetical protein [Arthrobacter sp. MSA 4-2]|uniref:hypothetical protein n=1 Tax=Arthrobacter sp. MSA 4-2 TaxID=2794349 RepID=UPI0027DC3213|nr:hypothetical protein [Arthrobacter sp. MSA 4-2]